jgi:hypothetical protein
MFDISGATYCPFEDMQFTYGVKYLSGFKSMQGLAIGCFDRIVRVVERVGKT